MSSATIRCSWSTLEDFSTTLNTWEAGTADRAVWIELLSDFWRFALTDNPSPLGGFEWPTYDAEADQHKVYDTTVRVGSNAAEKCDFWAGEDYLVSELRRLNRRAQPASLRARWL